MQRPSPRCVVELTQDKMLFDQDGAALLFTEIEHYLDLYEDWGPEKFSSTTNITKIFQLSLLIEEACKTIKDNNSEAAFNETLSRWCNDNRWAVYDLLFLEKSCDHMLKKIFKISPCVKLREQAYRQYTACCSSERATDLLDTIRKESTILTAIFQLNNILSAYDKPEDKNAKQILFKCSLLYQQCKLNVLKDIVRQLFYKDITAVDSILKALTPRIGNKTDDNTNIKQIIMTTMMDSINYDETIRSQFWKMSCWAEQRILGEVALMYPTFLNAMVSFIIISAHCMKLQIDSDLTEKWVTSDDYLSYTELIVLIETLVSANGAAEFAIWTAIDENSRSHKGNKSIWEELKKRF